MPSSDSGGRAWAALAGLLVAGALAASLAPPTALDWQPALAAAQPWRAWSAAFVHFSALHLAANVAGAVLVAALGLAGGVPRRGAVAWLVAWPLTQVGLLAGPELLHYGGLSGVLHAGVACVALLLVIDGAGRRRWVGAATLLLLTAKVVNESPWGPALRHPPGWDIAVAPFAHASGLVAGLACAAIAEAWHRRPRRAPAAGDAAH